MIYKIDASDASGTHTSVATEDAREALQSLLAFEAANFAPIFAYDENGRILLASDLLQIVDRDP